MNTLDNMELAMLEGGNAFQTWGEQAAADGLRHAGSTNPGVAGSGLLLASAGGWAYILGSAWELF